MAKEFTYTLISSGKVIYTSVEPNSASRDTVDLKVKDKTGRDPRLERHLLDVSIRVVNEPKAVRSFGRFDKNKRIT